MAAPGMFVFIVRHQGLIEDKQEPPKAEKKSRNVDLRFGNAKVNAQSLRISYQEESFSEE